MRIKVRKKPLISSMLVIVLITTLGISLFYQTKKADAVGVNIAGRAQILNTNGYLNFTDYSANVSTSNIGCTFNGYAWSSDIGWVAFGSTDNPDGPVTCDLTTGILSGKAKVINDGSIIDFNFDPYGSNVRILSSGNFIGYAWSTALGWINFTGVSAPGISLVPPNAPQNVRIYDTSDRDLAEYSITLRWQTPTSLDGEAFESYLVERGTNGTTFAQVASTSSLGYLDTTVLTGTTYYYRIKAKYTSGTIASSEIVFQNPTGRFTTPPNLEGTPVVEAKPSSVDFSWRTDREASSYVRITQGNTFVSEQGHSLLEKAHEVSITGLKPGIIYNYQLVWLDQDGNEGKGNIEEFKTADAPYISEVNISNITLNSALITWKSTSITKTNLHYGKDINYGYIKEESSESGTTNHSIFLQGLETGTKYHFRIRGDDIDNNTLISDDYQFDTLPLPIVENLKIEALTDKARSALRASWTTNVATTTILKYKTSSDNYKEVVKSKSEKEHIIEVDNLQDSSEYTIIATGRDILGNLAESQNQIFTTPFDTRSAIISNVVVETSNVGLDKQDKAQIAVSWQTDEPTTSMVEYSEGISGSDYTQRTTEDKALTTSHLVIIPDLTPNKPYHIRVVSTDKGNNISQSPDHTVIPGDVPKSALQIILQTFKHLFGWLGM